MIPTDEAYPHWLRLIRTVPQSSTPVDDSCRVDATWPVLVRGSPPCSDRQQPAQSQASLPRTAGRSVSGLALGVDTLCHEAALEAGGHTVAILANGLDSVYPGQNRELAARILAAGGALLSEQPLGAPALPRNLVARDRLQSGMSAATIVMQTDLIGGTMHTVRYAVLQGRPLIAPVPQGTHADAPKSRGIPRPDPADGDGPRAPRGGKRRVCRAPEEEVC